MNSSNLNKSALLCLLVAFSGCFSQILSAAPSRSKKGYKEQEEEKKGLSTGAKVGIGMAVGAAVGAVGAYAASWLSSPSDENLIKEAKKLDIEVSREYLNDAVAVLEGGYSINCSSCRQSVESEIMRRPLETVLASLADIMAKHGYAYNDYSSRLGNKRDALRKQHQELMKRSDKNYDKGMREVAREMVELAQDLEITESKLTFLRHYLKHHASYFDLNSNYKRACSIYYQEINMLPQSYYASVYNCYSGVTYPFMNNASFLQNVTRINARYPYLEYVNKIDSEIKTLSRTISNTAYTYEIVDKVRFLHNLLVEINRQVLASREYAHDLNMRERDRLEQERMRLEYERKRLEDQRRQERVEYEARLAREARERAAYNDRLYYGPQPVYVATPMYVPVAEPRVDLDLTFTIPLL